MDSNPLKACPRVRLVRHKVERVSPTQLGYNCTKAFAQLRSKYNINHKSQTRWLQNKMSSSILGAHAGYSHISCTATCSKTQWIDFETTKMRKEGKENKPQLQGV